MVGYVSEEHIEDGAYSVIIIDENAYHKPRLQRGELECVRYTGGCTVVAFIRHCSKNTVRIAVMGDTRALIIGASPAMEQILSADAVFQDLGKLIDPAAGGDVRGFGGRLGGITPGSFLSYPHDVFNTAELHRIKRDFSPDDYEIDEPYLVNPLTGC
jgi:hypothetical protein